MVRVSRAQIYRVIFILAGAYNIVLGAWAVLAPRALFEVFDLGAPSHPGIWACLGMVIGLYGLIYLQVAFTDPKRRSSAVVIGKRRIEYDVTRFLIGIGLVGKILGPIGFVLALRNGALGQVYSFSKSLSCFRSVTGALQVKFSHTYTAGFPSTSDIARTASFLSPRYFCPSFASARITIVFGRKWR